VDRGEALPVAQPETFETLIARLEHDHAAKHCKAPLKLKQLRAAFAAQGIGLHV